MTIAKYPLSQAASCQTIRIIWTNCKNNMVPIHSFKSQITAPYCDEQIALTNAADALPDDAARSMVHEMIRQQMVSAGNACTRKWQALKIYINGVYENEAERITQYNGAGWSNYENAANESWAFVQDLMQSGYNYIVNNTATLEGADHDNMPAGFPAEFKAAWDDFKSKWLAFTNSQESASTGGAQKVKDINLCYQKVIDLCEIGQHVFRDDEELRKQFSFEAVGALIAPAGPASFEVTVMVNGSAKPGAEVSIVNTDKNLVTDADGKALFLQMGEGDIQCRIVCDGYAQQLVTETITAGVRKRVSVTLQPLFTGEFEVGSQPVNTNQQSTVNSQQSSITDN